MQLKATLELRRHSKKYIRKHRLLARKCEIYGDKNEVFGKKNLVQGDYCVVTGDYNTVIGSHCTVKGRGNQVIGDHNTVQGDENEITGNNNTASGHACTCQGEDNVYNGSRVNMQDVKLPPKSHVDEAALGDSDACVVCLINKKCCASMPCKHLCLCVTCSHELAKDASRVVCPVCRTPIEEIMLMF